MRILIIAYRGVLAFAEPHLKRLYEAAKALDMDIGATPKQLLQMIYNTVDANGMATASGVHIRLIVSRGLKSTPYQNPKVTVEKPTIVVLPEWKEASQGTWVAHVALTSISCMMHISTQEAEWMDLNCYINTLSSFR